MLCLVFLLMFFAFFGFVSFTMGFAAKMELEWYLKSNFPEIYQKAKGLYRGNKDPFNVDVGGYLHYFWNIIDGDDDKVIAIKKRFKIRIKAALVNLILCVVCIMIVVVLSFLP